MLRLAHGGHLCFAERQIILRQQEQCAAIAAASVNLHQPVINDFAPFCALAHRFLSFIQLAGMDAGRRFLEVTR
jgi:hypothetical protein